MADSYFLEQANTLRPKLIARRRDLHRHPELGFEEIRTAGIVAQTLSDLGLEIQRGIGKTGVVAILEGSYEGPTVLVRADMDALPITEENQTDFVSTIPGKMHACGHDGHTSIALGVAEILTSLRDQIHGRIKFVFQPAEEIGKGARAMVTDGVLTEPRPDFTVGLHLWNSLATGILGVADGPVMAGASSYTVKISGRGGHAASPHMVIDPVVCAAQVISAFQAIISRNVDPFDSAVISVSEVKAGDTHNVIPQFANLTGTIRYFRPEVRDLLIRRMEEVTELMTRGMGCTGEIAFQHLTVPVANHPEVGALLRARFEPIVGSAGLDTSVRTMGAEDVGIFMDDIPGMYFFVGARDNTLEEYYPHHHPRFSFDEEALPLAAALLSTAVAAYVLPDV